MLLHISGSATNQASGPKAVSPSLQTTIAAPYRVPAWDANPKDTADRKALIGTLGDETAAATREMQEKLGVNMEPTVIDGVKAFILTPKVIAPENTASYFALASFRDSSGYAARRRTEAVFTGGVAEGSREA